MSSKKVIKFGNPALTEIANGVHVLSKTVGSTLGPGGRNVIFENIGSPLVTKDGVTVANQIDLEDKLQNIGVQMVKHVAKKTCDDAGDGPQPLDTKIMTPNGHILMKDIKVGDVISGSHGSVQKVIGVFNKGEQEIYEVQLIDGRKTRCTINHLWNVSIDNTQEQTLPLGDIWREFLYDKEVKIPVQEGVCEVKWVSLESIKKLDSIEPVVCIKVSNLDELYVTDDNILTHNTTTSVILSDGILQEGLKTLSTGVNPIDVQRGIDKSVNAVIDYIENNVRVDVGKDKERLKQISMVSANWDEEVSSVVANAIMEIGLEGTIKVSENRAGYETVLKIVDGINFDRGYINPYFINNSSKQICEMTNPYILLYRGKLDNVDHIFPLLKEVKKEDASLFIIADDYDVSLITTFVENKVRAGVKICAIKAPHYKDMRLDTMEDLSILTNGELIDHNNGDSVELEDASLKHLGRCEKIICTSNKTTLIGFGTLLSKNKEEQEKKHTEWEKRLNNRINEIRSLSVDKNVGELISGNARLRLNQIKGKAAFILVGGASEIETREKLDRIDDALCATKCALKDGIVPGAGYSYLKASSKCEKLKELLNSDNEGDRIGAQIVKKILTVPFKKLLYNAGMEDECTSIMQEVINSKDNEGYNLKTKKIENLLEAGVVDPWLVTKSALKNAASVAGLILTSTAVVTDVGQMEQVNVYDNLAESLQ